MQCKPHLFEVVRALDATCRFAGRLNCWQKKSDEKTDDRDDDQKFDEGKPSGDVFAHRLNPEKMA
jgi:hypothetical protein